MTSLVTEPSAHLAATADAYDAMAVRYAEFGDGGGA